MEFTYAEWKTIFATILTQPTVRKQMEFTELTEEDKKLAKIMKRTLRKLERRLTNRFAKRLKKLRKAQKKALKRGIRPNEKTVDVKGDAQLKKGKKDKS